MVGGRADETDRARQVITKASEVLKQVSLEKLE